ncbi:uncharacterized protein LOC119836594 [Zerene cesonia]|uniref:uncharacterized protein LOC119836594 n=1 Tax=Zerene cesonia TaxID=33412 RepID=UPI0018E5611B|nr:uncharacterized protein LOC119836594 [Zerene cesonia]
MIALTGESLPKRQQELNAKVKEAIRNAISFNDIKDLEEKSDIDKLYKIDVALRNKNIDYIVEVLKCGDSLYVSRALKCDWLYNYEYAYIINPDCLQKEIFPHMSPKIKTKMIKTIAVHIKNETRAAAFYEYLRSLKINKLAFKFLLSTSEAFKLNALRNNLNYIGDFLEHLPHLIGNSLTLAKAYISELNSSYKKEFALIRLSYLFNIDNNQYLDLFENNSETKISEKFGGKISKSIMTKHKERVLRSPLLYVPKIKKYMLLRHSTTEDAKIYITAFFPKTLHEFWQYNFYNEFKYIFDLIPKTEVFIFFKSTFVSNFGNQPFEMDVRFYRHKYYNILSVEEREKWARQHIERGEELLGSNNDYIWYIVNFDEALKGIKQYVLVATNHKDRDNMVSILIESSRNQRDLENLFDYYYKRFVNESDNSKDEFLSKIVEKKNVLEFDDACWKAFNKILHSVGVYIHGSFCNRTFKLVSLIYNIIHGKEIHSAILHYIDSYNVMYWDLEPMCKRLNKEESYRVYKFLLDYFCMKFEAVNNDNIDFIKQEKVKFATKLIDLLPFFNRTNVDLPLNVLSFIEANIQEFPSFRPLHSHAERKEKLTEVILLRMLKKDKNLVSNKVSEIKESMNDNVLRLKRLMSKIRIYFSDDLANDFVNLFTDCIENNMCHNNYSKSMFISSTAVFGMFQLAIEATKLNFLNKYAPKEGKIAHDEIDSNVLLIQEQICRFACYSRPPVPLESITQYIKGDYIHFCLPMLNMYLVGLPSSTSIKLTEFLLNNPVSIQKHGIRLAFHVYSTDHLKTLIPQIWQRTKNVSLRVVIYKGLVKKIANSLETSQDELIDILILITSRLIEDDQNELYDTMFTNDIPSRFKKSLLRTAWNSVQNFSSNKTRTLTIKERILSRIIDYSPDRDFLRTQLIDQHVNYMLHENGIIQNHKSEMTQIHDQLWRITFKYIVTCSNQSELEESLTLLQIILELLFKRWNVVVGDKFVIIEFFVYFIKQLKVSTYYLDSNNEYVIAIFEQILKRVQDFFPAHAMFRTILDVKLYIMMRKIKAENPTGIEQVAKIAHKSLLLFIQDLRENNKLYPNLRGEICSVITASLRTLATMMSIKHDDILIAYVCNEIILGADMLIYKHTL